MATMAQSDSPPRAPALGLFASIAFTAVAAIVGSVASVDSASYYQTLIRPSWAPPAWLFGPVWTGLYLMMAVAAWLVWRDAGVRGARTSLGLYAVQLVFNAAWTWIFFSWQERGWALVEILVLWTAIAATIIAFRRHNKMAALLLVPYLAWVTFATCLNASIWRLNG